MKIHKKIICLFFCLILILTGCKIAGQTSVTELNHEEGFSFIYMGDSQADPETGNYSEWGKLINKAASDESHPAFVMMGGDLVNDGNDQKEWDTFFNAGGDALKKLPLYPAIGNHDYSDRYKEIFDLPNNGPEGKEEEFYSFDYGDAHFTVLNSNVMGAAEAEIIEWLKKDLAETDRAYKIVMFHHPAYPAIDIPKDNARAETIQKHFVPIIEDAGVSLVMTGHQHVYMRTYPLKAGAVDESGIVYLMGTSGGKQYEAGSFDYIASSISNQPVYSIITVNKTGISIETRNAEGEIVDSTKGPEISEDQKDLFLNVSGDGIAGKKTFTLEELASRPDTGFSHIYSTINNWPAARFYAAKGITVRSILKTAGVLDTAQVITFRSPDSYEVSFTRKQLLDTPQYYFPDVENGTPAGAERVEPIIAYEYKEGSSRMEEAVPDSLCLIIGQRDPLEHTNPAYVADIAEIIISENPPETWDRPTTFPMEGRIPAGEQVKLQHKYIGLVKLHYTTDGSDPTPLSPMYNPSTYQPELNRPITIKDDTVVKVFATGYGKEDSDIAVYHFIVE